MIMTYVTIAALLGLVLSPILIPAMIGAVHTVAGWRGAYQSMRSVVSPRVITAGRVAVPAAA
jgi:ABC-type transport system involved in cytochrome c biogenesis permease component